ncbi:MAG TPA: YceI family protein [Thermoanaerobaculia bacterium]|nr:YceI family protein [Thermoanaerobaculia bacterium]
MHKKILIFALFTLLALPFAAAAEQTTWNVDQAHSNVGFSVRHFLTQVPGHFDDFDGTIVYDAENPSNSSVDVTVQAASIDTNNENRDKHLRSPDFFATEEHPTLTFKSKKVAKLGADKLSVTGDLTIRGTTQEVTIPVEVLGVMGEKAGFATEFVIDRQEYGVQWNRALDNGGTILSDEVKIRLDFEVNLQKEEMEGEEAAE